MLLVNSVQGSYDLATLPVASAGRGTLSKGLGCLLVAGALESFTPLTPTPDTTTDGGCKTGCVAGRNVMYSSAHFLHAVQDD